MVSSSVSESPVLILGYKYQMMIYHLAVSVLQWQILFNLFNLRSMANSFESWEFLRFSVQIMAKPWACTMWNFTPFISWFQCTYFLVIQRVFHFPHWSSPAYLCELTANCRQQFNGKWAKCNFWECLMIFTMKLNKVWKSSYYPHMLPGSSLFNIHASSGLQMRVYDQHSAILSAYSIICSPEYTGIAFTSSKMLITFLLNSTR